MAKRFQFRLETIERLRKQARDEQRRAVAAAVRALGASEARIADLTEQLRRDVEMTRGDRRVGRINVAALAGNQFHRNWLHQRIVESVADVDHNKSLLDQERTRLAEATARVKVLEKLRERRWTRHQLSVVREAQAATDEIGGLRFLRGVEPGE